jgi:aminomethyltransferase
MLRTALFDTHKRLGARLIDFGGWEMPVSYGSIIDEHQHTRNAASVFDVSHMGRLELSGSDAEALLQHLCTRNVSKLAVGRSGYSHICNAAGGVLDDVIVSRYASHWLVVCNAGNREKIVRHIQQHSAGRDVALDDQTLESVMFAVQGPATMELFRKHLPIDLGELKRYGFKSGAYMGMQYSLFRSGYTGEDGVEVVLPTAIGSMAWDYLTRQGESENQTVKPAGLGARDTLRLEAGMPLYGHELGESIDPISAGCKWCVDLSKDFLGVEELRRIDSAGPRRRITGLVLEGKRIARQGMPVTVGSDIVGEVTSGTLSPTLEKSIAMAFVDSSRLKRGDGLSIDMKGTQIAATPVPLPFYKRRQ